MLFFLLRSKIRMNLHSSTITTVGCVFMVMLLLVGIATSSVAGLAYAATSSGNLTVNTFSLPNGDTISALVEIQANGTLIKSGFAPLTIQGKEDTIYTIKVSSTPSFAFDHWEDGSTSNIRAVLFSNDLILSAFFKQVPTSPNLTVKTVTANGEELHMWATVKSGIQTIDTGITPFSFSGAPGKTYQLSVENQEAQSSTSGGGNATLPTRPAPVSIIFNHWEDSRGTDRTRSITIPADGSTINLVGVYNKGSRVTLQDLGTLQLMSHDIYNTVRDGPHPGNLEDERLNLSTVLDHGDDQIINGGEPRNTENVALHTVAVKLGKMYLSLIIDKKMSPEEARKETVQAYLQMAKEAYEDAFHEQFPDPAPSSHEVKPDGSDNLTGDLSLRSVHSFVPGHIMVNGVDTPVLDPSLRGKTLSDQDLQQLSKPLDGTFDPVFRNVTIFIPPPNPPPNEFTIDLFERDSTFAKQFGTDVSFEEFMNELKDGQYDEGDKVMFYIREDVANALTPLDNEGDKKTEVSGSSLTPAAQNTTAVINTTPAIANITPIVNNTKVLASGAEVGTNNVIIPPTTTIAAPNNVMMIVHNKTLIESTDNNTEDTNNTNLSMPLEPEQDPASNSSNITSAPPGSGVQAVFIGANGTILLANGTTLGTLAHNHSDVSSQQLPSVAKPMPLFRFPNGTLVFQNGTRFNAPLTTTLPQTTVETQDSNNDNNNTNDNQDSSNNNTDNGDNNNAAADDSSGNDNNSDGSGGVDDNNDNGGNGHHQHNNNNNDPGNNDDGNGKNHKHKNRNRDN